MSVRVDMESSWQRDVITRAIIGALESENVNVDCSVEVVIESEYGIQALNSSYRGIDRVTDVLSFPMFESKADIVKDSDGTAFLGSVVICRARAEQQADMYGHSISREAAFLAVHSILHLLGYDHERSENDEREMFEKQNRVLESLGITR